MSDHAGLLAAKIESRKAKIGVIGLGYVGLPLCRAFARGGYPVLGFDVDPKKIQLLRDGQSYLKHIPDADVAAMRQAHFEPTCEFDHLHEPDVIIVCVPTPLTEAREPDLSFIVNSTKAIANFLRPGQLIILESTTYPGTTRDVVLPLLTATGLVPGKDFFLAFSPEREDPGNSSFHTQTIPKVVGGLDEPSRKLAAAVYGKVIVKVVEVSSPEVAEACKILENTYRAVNIALVNELKVLYDRMGIDVWEVIDAAKTKPFGYQAFYPGPGLGGHCIPIDPFYLTWVARKFGLNTRFIELAGEVNHAMPGWVVHKVGEALNEHRKPIKGSKVTLLGMAYKKDVDDSRESPGFEIMELLLHKGAELSYNDPHIPRLPPKRAYPDWKLESRELTPEFLASQDCVVIVTDHSAYDYEHIVRHARLIVDTRNATKGVKAGREKIVRA
jgi:UDP-N-acetyl-D-glucosamine dehydrogenase